MNDKTPKAVLHEYNLALDDLAASLESACGDADVDAIIRAIQERGPGQGPEDELVAIKEVLDALAQDLDGLLPRSCRSCRGRPLGHRAPRRLPVGTDDRRPADCGGS